MKTPLDRKQSRLLLTALGMGTFYCGIWSPQANAQDLPEDSGITFQEERRENDPAPVADRPQPLYDAPGIPAGPFRLFPELEIGAVYNSNLLATSNNAVGDVGLILAPRLRAHTNWSGGSINLYLRSRVERYADRGTEDTEQLWGGVHGRLNIRRSTTLRFAAEAGTFVEDRTSNLTPTDALEPIEFDRIYGNVRLDTRAGRFQAQLGVEYDNLWFRNAESGTNPGTVIVQTTRNRARMEPSVQLSYDLSYDTMLFGTLRYNRRDYEAVAPQDRDSTGGGASLGLRFRPTPLMRAQIAAGFIWQNYATPLRDIGGLYAEASLEWFFTQLTTVTARLRRDVAESSSTISGGAITTRVSLRIDHELLRNLILSAEGGFETYDFSEISRLDRRYRALLSARYRANPRLELNGRIEYLRQSSSGLLPTLDFSQARIVISAIGRW